MRKNKIKKFLFSNMVLSALVLQVAPVIPIASTVQAEEISTIIKSNDDDINQLLSQTTIDKSSEESLNKSISSIQTIIDKYEAKNKELQAQVDELAKTLDTTSKNVIARTKQLKKQAKSMQTSNSSNIVIDTLMSSKSFGDAISKITAMTTISSANDKAIKELEEQKAKLEEQQKENQEKINEIDNNSKLLNEKKAELEVAKTELLRIKAQDETARAEAETKLKEAETKLNETQNVNSSISQTSQTNVSASSVGVTIDNSNNTYPIGQCTWGVKAMASWVGNYWGNANQWGASAQAAGHTIGNVPRAGAVAVWPYDGGGYGHVAYVTEVQSQTSIRVMESNYAGNQSIGDYRGMFNPTDATWGGGTVYYIYQ